MSGDRFEPVIGLEVHAQLLTRSKLFCSCGTSFGAPPNSQVCPVCLGHPGALPVPNREAVSLAIRIGLATGCSIRRVSVWARKHYFYPDLPKNYQISQYDRPLCEGGSLVIHPEGRPKRIGITRIHMEEDAGKSKHPERSGETRTRVDLNRCGTPLVEIVSGPDLGSPEEAHAYLTALREILRHTGVCDGNMEEGSLRCDANVSVRPRGSVALGTRTELKNLNSFRFVERALRHEIERQVACLERGGAIEQETRLFDPVTETTRAMRGKEDAHDYRYFPDPDLPPLVVSDAWIEEVRRGLPELPEARRARFANDYGLSAGDALALSASRDLADYFELVVRGGPEPKSAANWILSELLGHLKKRDLPISSSPVPAGEMIDLLRRIAAGSLTGKLAKAALEEMAGTGEACAEVVKRHGWEVLSDDASIQLLVDEVIASNPGGVAEYREGKAHLFRWFVGQVMKRSKGQADPIRAEALVRRSLDQPLE